MKQFFTLFKNGKKSIACLDTQPDPDLSDAEKNLIDLYPEVRFQRIEGFGGAFTDAAGYVFSLMPEEMGKQLLKDYFSPEGLGYTFGRTSIDSCDFSTEMYAADDDPDDRDLSRFDMERPLRYVLPLLLGAEEAAGQPIRMMLTPWSPPAWMKTNASRKHGGHLKKECRAMWAEYICRYILEAEKAGMRVCFLSSQNEPAASQTWDSCLYTGTEEGEFIRDFLYPALIRHGLAHVALLIRACLRDPGRRKNRKDGGRRGGALVQRRSL